MKKIGILSDTHAFWDDRYRHYFESCDQIWHAGDIGSVDLADALAQIAPFKGVYGNADGHVLRRMFDEVALFEVEDVKVMIIHIGGYPGKYAPGVKALLKEHRPNVLVSGHSHILKVMFDRVENCLYINPGAAGKQGFHKVRTLIRFTIDQDRMKDLEVIELETLI